jgi:hypothetical protein
MIYMDTFLQLLDQNFICSEIISAKTTAIHSALSDMRRLNMRNVIINECITMLDAYKYRVWLLLNFKNGGDL